jgi:hypothetical protein
MAAAHGAAAQETSARVYSRPARRNAGRDAGGKEPSYSYLVATGHRADVAAEKERKTPPRRASPHARVDGVHVGPARKGEQDVRVTSCRVRARQELCTRTPSQVCVQVDLVLPP